MPVEIRAPDGSIARFPDGTPDEVITRVMRESFGGPSGQPAEPKGNRTSALSAGLEGVAQGLSFGFADEIEAGGKAALRKLMGDEQDLSSIYDESVANARSRADAAAEEHPIAYYGGDIGSSLFVPGGLAKLGIKSAVKAATGQGLKATMKAGAKEGAAYGAAYGAGHSEGGLEDRVTGAAGGAAFGGAFGGAAPALIEATLAATRPIANAVRSAVNPEGEAARLVTKAVDDDIALFQNRQMTPEELAKRRDAGTLVQQGRAGDDLRNIDLAGENTRALARSAANNSPEARDVIQRSNDARFEGQSNRTVDFIRGLVPTAGNAPQTREALSAAAKKANRPLYDAAYKAGERGITTPGLKSIEIAPAVQSAMKAALQNIRNKTGAGRVGSPQGPQGPTLQFWDQTARELKDQFTSLSRQGAKEAAADVQALRRQLLDELDAAVPEYRQARGVAAEYFKADDAIEAGENFVTGRFTLHDAGKALKRMSQAEQEGFREGFVSKLISDVERTGDRRNILGRIASSPDARQRIEVALGPNKARELEAFLYLEQLMDMPRRAMGNSTTARQLVELGLASGAGMLAGGGSLTDPTTWIVGIATKYGAGKARAAVDQKLAKNIADMLVSNDEAVFRKGIQQAAHSPILDAMREFTAALGSSGVGRAAGGAAAQEETQPPQYGGQR